MSGRELTSSGLTIHLAAPFISELASARSRGTGGMSAFSALQFCPDPNIPKVTNGVLSPKVPCKNADNAHACVEFDRRERTMGSISSISANTAQATAQTKEVTVDVGFTTTLKGTTYDADVTFTNGQYIAEDAKILGAEATGTSVPLAENNLIDRIDTLV
jgi:hypothetical protein